MLVMARWKQNTIPVQFVVILINLIGLIYSAEQKQNEDNESPTTLRDTSHIWATLSARNAYSQTIDESEAISAGLQKLTKIYHETIRPMEDLYHYVDLDDRTITDGYMKAKPMVLFVGPWSTGKSTMINYFAQIDNPQHHLHSSAEPTTSDFTVVTKGPHYKTIDGLVLATDPEQQFSNLEKFGQRFLEKFKGVEMNYPILDLVTFVDTPGIIENRKQQERGYPFNQVMEWFIAKASLICIVFDPSKLDVGHELESLFQQLKGSESKIRIILNKADSIRTQELMRVYGALFWNLQPLIKVIEPPRVYTGSFWWHVYKKDTNNALFHQEEISLLQDIHQVIANQVENKVVFIRQHAYLVRIHALLVDRYVQEYKDRKSIFQDNSDLIQDIVRNPEKSRIYQSVLADPYISKFDLPATEKYEKFFHHHALNTFHLNKHHCTLFSGCPMDVLLEAINVLLPTLLKDFKTDMKESSQCSADGCN